MPIDTCFLKLLLKGHILLECVEFAFCFLRITDRDKPSSELVIKKGPKVTYGPLNCALG